MLNRTHLHVWLSVVLFVGCGADTPKEPSEMSSSQDAEIDASDDKPSKPRPDAALEMDVDQDAGIAVPKAAQWRRHGQ